MDCYLVRTTRKLLTQATPWVISRALCQIDFTRPQAVVFSWQNLGKGGCWAPGAKSNRGEVMGAALKGSTRAFGGSCESWWLLWRHTHKPVRWFENRHTSFQCKTWPLGRLCDGPTGLLSYVCDSWGACYHLRTERSSEKRLSILNVRIL